LSPLSQIWLREYASHHNPQLGRKRRIGFGCGDGGPVSNIAVLESEILGHHDEELAWARRLLELPPVTANSVYHIAWPLVFLRDDHTSERWLKDAVQYLLAALDYLRGNESAALSRARKVVDTAPGFEEGLTVLAELTWVHACRRCGSADRALVSPRARREQWFEAVLNKMEQAVAAMRVRSAALAEPRSIPVPRLARTR
jgi:hypothetical protein